MWDGISSLNKRCGAFPFLSLCMRREGVVCFAERNMKIRTTTIHCHLHLFKSIPFTMTSNWSSSDHSLHLDQVPHSVSHVGTSAPPDTHRQVIPLSCWFYGSQHLNDSGHGTVMADASTVWDAVKLPLYWWWKEMRGRREFAQKSTKGAKFLESYCLGLTGRMNRREKEKYNVKEEGTEWFLTHNQCVCMCVCVFACVCVHGEFATRGSWP